VTTILFIVAAIVVVLLYLGFIWSAPDMSHFDHPEEPLVIGADEVSDQHEEVVKMLADYHGQPAAKDIHTGRQRFEEVFAREVDIEVQPVDIAGVPGEWVLAEGANPDVRVLFIHGGAFMVGSPKTHRFLTAEISKRTSAAVLAIDYRMLPEFKIIHCHEDTRMAYQWILENGPGTKGPASKLYVAGDSAGGNLTLAVIAWARNNRLRAADGAIAFAPMTDSTMSGPSWKENIETDHFLGPSIGRLTKIPGFIRKLASRFQSGKPANDPELSPLLGNLANLPATLIQVSRHEMLYADAQRYANKAKHEGSEITLQVWPTLVHVFQAFDNLPETDDALDKVASFINERNRA
jgi:monoterpene epsilon-lactone hydrolase